jgi:hypothetical protein
MPDTLPPDPADVIEELINIIAADAALETGSIIQTALGKYGTYTLSLAANPSETGRYNNIRFGNPAIPADGLSVYLFSKNNQNYYDSAPGGCRYTYNIRVEGYWRDTATASDPLSAHPERLHRLLTSFSWALSRVLGPENLNTVNGAWIMTDGSALSSPVVSTIVPAATVQSNQLMQGEKMHYCALNWTAFNEYLVELPVE